MDRRLFLRAAGVVGTAIPLGGLTVQQLRDLLDVVARESWQSAGIVDGADVGRPTLDQIDAEVRRIAAAYVSEAALPLFVQMTAVRDQVFQLLNSRPRTVHASELGLMAGQVLCLLANASLDFGSRDAAAQHARMAWVYGDDVGHDSLCGMARAMEALIAYWSGEDRGVVALAVDGRRYARSGALRARLWALEARAHARLGDAGAAMGALAAAHDAMGQGSDPLSDGVGGEFAFQPARLTGSSAIVHGALGDHAQAAQEAALAVDLWRSSPPAERSYGCEALSLIDQAKANVHLGEVAGAAEVLAPVLRLPASHHIELYANGLSTVRGLLGSERHDDAESASLAEEIDAFTARLPRLSSLTA